LKAETVELLAFGKVILPEGSIYIQKELDIKMRYEVEADGNFSKFIKITLISSFRSINQCRMCVSTNGRFLWPLLYQKRAYLKCINSRGSTFTKEQFNYNRIHRDGAVSYTCWLLVQQPLRDKRCLWTHLSIPRSSRGCLRHLRKCVVFLVPVVASCFPKL